MISYPVPLWKEEMYQQYQVGNFHQFLFDGNIHDRFFWPYDDAGEKGQLYPFREFLIRVLLRAMKAVVYYSSTTGPIVFPQGAEPICIHGDFHEDQGSLQQLPNRIEKLIEKAAADSKSRMSQQMPDRIIRELSSLEKQLRTNFVLATGKDEKNEAGNEKCSIAIIVDYLDKILRHGMATAAERLVSEILERWGAATDTEHISILITENREWLPQTLQNESAGTLPIQVDFPDAEYRKLFFETVAARENQDSILARYLTNHEDGLQTLTQLTRGFRIIDCQFIQNICEKTTSDEDTRNHFFRGREFNEAAVVQLVNREKKEVIQSISNGILIPLESEITFDVIGGLEGVITYFTKISKALRDMVNQPENREIVPKGVLLAGPPGTGKSLLAKALAREAGVSLVKMGDIRSMWVGESEKNMTLTLNLLKAMAPVIVFVDEIDQAIGRRTGSTGDSGVSGRIFGKILEFMGDNDNRGKVVWIAATNRADLLDDAMIRRFDRVIPVLLPGSAEEWIRVIEGICKQIKHPTIQISAEEIEKFVNFADDQEPNLKALRRDHSGSSMEVIIRRAYENAVEKGQTTITAHDIQAVFKNFKTNFNQQVYELQTLISIAACNELTFFQEPSGNYSYGSPELDEIILEAHQKRSNKRLQERIFELQNIGITMPSI